MKINNKRIKSYIQFIYLLIGTLFVLFLVTKFYPFRVFKRIPVYMFPVSGFILLIIMQYRGKQLFEYDSDGEALNFKNKDAVLSYFIPSLRKHSEFPKRKLNSYKINKNPLKKTLKVTIKSKKSRTGFSQLKYDISYLKKAEIKKIKKSLDKILEENKTNQNERIQ